MLPETTVSHSRLSSLNGDIRVHPTVGKISDFKIRYFQGNYGDVSDRSKGPEKEARLQVVQVVPRQRLPGALHTWRGGGFRRGKDLHVSPSLRDIFSSQVRRIAIGISQRAKKAAIRFFNNVTLYFDPSRC